MNSLLKSALIVGGAGLAALVAGRALLRRARWFEFRDKVVIVTGGSRGLGLEIARQLVDAGARVAICARTLDQLVAAEWELSERGDAVAFQCDVRDRDQVQLMVDRIIQRWGTVDVLFNVAGVIEVGPLDAM